MSGRTNLCGDARSAPQAADKHLFAEEGVSKLSVCALRLYSACCTFILLCLVLVRVLLLLFFLTLFFLLLCSNQRSYRTIHGSCNALLVSAMIHLPPPHDEPIFKTCYKIRRLLHYTNIELDKPGTAADKLSSSSLCPLPLQQSGLISWHARSFCSSPFSSPPLQQSESMPCSLCSPSSLLPSSSYCLQHSDLILILNRLKASCPEGLLPACFPLRQTSSHLKARSAHVLRV